MADRFERQQKEIVAPLESFLVTTYGRINEAGELSENARFHNISGIFADIKEPLFIDGVHVADRGNRIVAERMSEDMAVVLVEELREKSTVAGTV